jgi:16S rRNA (cytidine1402-2'-O)-methyltransferase
LNSTAHHNDSSAAAKVNVIGGHVYFVATPIGNLDDITLRAINVLTNADVVCVEDSRHSVHLLRHLGIQHKTMVSHHEHNLQSSIPRILDLARSGKSIAVVSDAGTPGISDPGAQLAEALGRAKVMMMC